MMGGYGEAYSRAPQPQVKLTTARFAFVVQVVEAESFAAEED